MNPANRPIIIAVVGGSGAGKTWFAERLCRAIGGEASHLALDDFYRDRSHLSRTRRARLNFDVPGAIDWPDATRVLHDCRAGLPTRVPRYNFATYSREAEPRSLHPQAVVVIEGLWLLRPPELRGLFDLSIFLDAPAELRRDRRLARDTLERGYDPASIQDRIVASVVPMHERYVEPQKRWADFVLAQPFHVGEVERLTESLWRLLATRRVLPCWTRETFGAEVGSLLLEHEYCN